MALVTMKELLYDARKKNYAVGGFNIFNFETMGAVVEVAEELKAPLVLGLPERLFKFVDVDVLSTAMVRAAQKAYVPIALHLDHAHSYEGVMKAIRWGFTSVMFDGSALPFEENIKRTKEITRIAHSLGISVEGELGYVGYYDDGPQNSEKPVIKAEMVVDFVSKSKIDALAVGVNHGHAHEYTGVNFSHLHELSQSVNVPLVMHGGSKLNKEDYCSSIQSGISKINIATDMSLAAAEHLKSELMNNPGSNYIHLMSAVKKGVKDSVRKYMLSFNCISKAI